MDIIADGIPIRATAGAQGRAARAMMVRLAALWALEGLRLADQERATRSAGPA